VGAGSLVGVGPVERADLVMTPVADGVDNVVQDIVPGDPAVRVGKAACQEVHAVGGAQGHLVAVGVEEGSTLGGIQDLVLHVNTTTGGGGLGGRLAGHEVVPGIVADVVRAARGVDAEDVDGAAFVAQLDAEVVAIHVSGPVGNAVSIDLAAQDTDGR